MVAVRRNEARGSGAQDENASVEAANDSAAAAPVLVRRAGAVAEIATLVVLLLSYIWIWNGAFPGHIAVVLVLYFGIGIQGHLRRGETPHDIGVRLDNFRRAFRFVATWVGPVAVLVVLTGLLLRSWRFPPLLEGVGSVAFGVLWGGAQQYGLTCILYRRLREVLPGRVAPILAGGVLFGLFHLPNPFLAMATLLLGSLACWLYGREPNLLALGIWHGLTSFAMFYALPNWLTIDMRVGPQILPYLAWPF